MTTTDQFATDHITTDDAAADELAAAVVAWIEREMGGTVVGVERQPRWRPAWFVDLDRDGETQHLYVRGERDGLDTVFPLTHEMRVLQVLEAEGIPVPHVYGLIPEPLAIVMDCVPGRADLSTVPDDTERAAVLDDYVEILTRMHAIDVSAFEAAGLERPGDPETLALNSFDRYVAGYRRHKARPEPLLEFGIKWVQRNVPRHRTTPTFVTCDSAQFMFDESRVTAIIDLEFAHLGDPAHDLASFRLRDIWEPLGDVGRALRRYRDLTGEALDLDVIDFHTVQWGLCTPLSLIAQVEGTPPIPELMMYFEWFHQLSLLPIECMAHLIGVQLEPVTLPPPEPTRSSGIHAALVGAVRGLAADDPVQEFQRDSTAAMAEYLRVVNEHEPAVETADLDDVADLLGTRFTLWQDADVALEQFVHDAGPEHDAALVRLFFRRTMRQLLLLEPILTKGGISRLVPLAQLVEG